MNDDKPLYEEESFWQRVKESPRTVSALIIILIVAAAIYAFSGDDQKEAEIAQEAATTENAVTEEAAVNAETEEAAKPEGQVAAGATDNEAAAEEPAVELPEARKTAEGYVEVANAGEGYTHLARKAVTRWLSENQASYQVTEEHRIFIEDYIQNRLGSEGLALGAEQTITFDLMEEAVAAAGELTEIQLNNLSQYTSALN